MVQFVRGAAGESIVEQSANFRRIRVGRIDMNFSDQPDHREAPL
jgi:hypothetical protein